MIFFLNLCNPTNNHALLHRLLIDIVHRKEISITEYITTNMFGVQTQCIYSDS